MSVSTISVTFTDEIDAYTNHTSDQCCKNHGDRTAVIDLLAVSGSPKFNKKENGLENKNHSLPKNIDTVSYDPSFTQNDKISVRNGGPPNQMVHSVKHVCNNYTEINKEHYDNTSSLTSVGLPQKQHYLILETNRADSRKSFTLNHKYREDENGHGTELRVYRYDGWQAGLCQTNCNGTKSTLV